MTRSKRPDQPPIGRDCCQRPDREGAGGQAGMGDCQSVRADPPATPRQDIEIEHPRPPAPPRPPPEIAFDRLQRGEQGIGIEIALDQRYRISEIAPRTAVGRVEHDRRGVEQAEILVQSGNGGADHPAGVPEAAVRAVGAERDGVEVDLGGQNNSVRPEPVEGLPFTSSALGRKTVLRQAQDERYGEA